MRLSRRLISQSEIDTLNRRLLIQVDKFDKKIGEVPMYEAHTRQAIEKGIIHRAFSLFVLDDKGRLLLQRRSAAKMTFPLCWSNTVCSHPLSSLNEAESSEFAGVKKAAMRRLFEELRVDRKKSPEIFEWKGSFFYTAMHDDTLGESEFDHVLLAKTPLSPQELALFDPKEVAELKLVPLDKVEDFQREVTAKGEKFTPWFNQALSVLRKAL